MNDALEMLRAVNETVSVPLELPEHDDLVDVEELILIGIPADFREYLLQASDVIYGYYEPVTAADPNSHTYLPEVASYAWSIGVPRELIPLCESRGDYYCVNEVGEVVLWRDGQVTEGEWPTIWHWIKGVWLADVVW
ncbi:SUKH superfamily protein [Sinobacterium caligoides]|uniref:SUKH superfamily protein n=1 Tax=Sinobacterium caligoides TaxID=933926 RepID=A0A3N2DNI0_9GAMM|nr:SMI1/KNR4 family protein [Sinobacterium caligoides]ROS01363.1 SUKH superfamily protein [Sinobacterium caligoides]